MGKNKVKSPTTAEAGQAEKQRKQQRKIRKNKQRNKNKNKNRKIGMQKDMDQTKNKQKGRITFDCKYSKRIKQNIRNRKIKQEDSSDRRFDRTNMKKKISIEQKKRSSKTENNQKIDQSYYAIDKVIKYRKLDGYDQYFVSWVGYPSTVNCWVDKDRIKGYDLQNFQQYLQELSIQLVEQDNNRVENGQSGRQGNNDQFLENSSKELFKQKQEVIKNIENAEDQQDVRKVQNKVQSCEIISVEEDSENNCNKVGEKMLLTYPYPRRKRHKNAYKVYHFPNNKINNNKLSKKRGKTKGLKEIKIISHPHKYKYRYSISKECQMLGNKTKQIQQEFFDKQKGGCQQVKQKEKGLQGVNNNYVEIDEDLEEINQKCGKNQKDENLFCSSGEQKSKNKIKQQWISPKNLPFDGAEMNQQISSFHKYSKEELDILRKFYYPHII